MNGRAGANGDDAHAAHIAIIGMAFRFPGGGASASTYWEFLNSGRTAIRETPRERFDIDACYSQDPDEPGTTYSRVAGYVEDPFFFDSKFFRISAAEAMEMDPQQRWMLELTWAALENAGLVPSQLRGKRVGLFMTAGEADYGRRTIASGDWLGITTYSKLGNLRAMTAGRVAHFFGFSGPAIFVDTTCSSSLVAIHLAAQSLRTGDCDIAVAGGVNLILGPEETIGVARLQAMSPSGNCRPFDAQADGYIRGEGGGAIVLRRMKDAVEQGDRIDAVLAGSAINSDGASNGLTAPNGAAQEAVIRQAIARADVRPEDIAYVEAHGTGTSVGDPIELSALRNVYSRDVQRRGPVLVGSVKSQVGHLEAAAGMAGIVKAILVLRHRYVPAQVNFASPNPRFRWDHAQIEIPRQGTPLDDEKQWVGISGFGITGTNAHLILASCAGKPAAPASAAVERVLTISARTPGARLRLAGEYGTRLRQCDVRTREMCYTASLRRDHFEHRLALVGATNEAFVEAIEDFLADGPSGRWHASGETKAKRLAFLIPGQGAWRPGTGAGLYAGNPLFRQHADACLRTMAADTARDVRDAILGRNASSVRHHPGQLAHFVVCFSLARTWMSLGLMPDLLIGHSLGEHVAAVLADVMTLADGLAAVEARGRLFDERTPRGAMLAVAAGVDELAGLFSFGADLFVAGINGPEQTVVSGTMAAVAKVEAAMLARGTRVTSLQTYDTPGHSPMLGAMRDAFRDALQPLTFAPARIPIVSTLTGNFATEGIAEVEHWLDLVEQPVRFHPALQVALDGDTVFLEAGPGAALSKLARAAAGGWQRAVSSLCDGPEGDDDTETAGFAHACARLYSMGRAIAWDKLYGNAPQPAELPTYPFDKERFELPFPERNMGVSSRGDAARPATFDGVDAARLKPFEVTAGSERTGEAAARETNPKALLSAIRAVAAGVASSAVELTDERPLIEQGMDSLALTEMRVRLQQAFGSMPPMSMLARGASLSTLADFFASSQAAAIAAAGSAGLTAKAGSRQALPPAGDGVDIDESALVVPLREGDGPLLALVHPVGGDVLCYGDLAAAWPGDASVVAIRHPYSDRHPSMAYLSIARLAALYRSAIVNVTGRVPDLLGGWSFGGWVAHEMAGQWESQGAAVPPLVIVDTPMQDGEFAMRLKEIVHTFDGEAGPSLVERLLADERFRVMLDRDFYLSEIRSRAHPDVFAHLARLHASNAAAVAEHRPRAIGAPIAYAMAAQGKADDARARVTAGLRLMTSAAVTVEVFDGDHNAIVRGHCAERVARFLSAAATGRTALMLATQA